MTGILPNNGVPPGSTQNGVANPTLAAGCENLYYGPRCNPRMDPFAMNAIISEVLNALNAIGQAYDCSRLDNLATAFLTLQNEPPPATPTGAPAAIIQHRLSNGVNAGPITVNTWQNRPLNNKTYDPGGIVNLAGNQFTPVVNTFVTWNTAFCETDRSKSRIWNVTDGVVTDVGTSVTAASIGGEVDGTHFSSGSAFLAAGKTYALQVWANNNAGSQPTEALGRASSAGVDELYAYLNFWRV